MSLFTEIVQQLAGSDPDSAQRQSWPRIFEANRDVLRDPDRIYPGQVPRIPSP
jgi:hypothetical protein